MNNNLQRFTQASQTAAASVITSYSTSFGLATGLLGSRHRSHVRNIYAMVRVADEIVDGVAAEAGMDANAQREQLHHYAAQLRKAVETGYSSDLVLHAFASTARACGITNELTDPFFESMEADIADPHSQSAKFYAETEYRHYVYGSAEVVGLMCLKVFLHREVRSSEQISTLENGARQLGAAFQNVNFLRDLADDTYRLQRNYLTTQTRLNEHAKHEWVNQVDTQLADARITVPLLPKDARAAVRAALALFEALNARVRRTPVEDLYTKRIRVPDTQKGFMTLCAMLQTCREARV